MNNNLTVAIERVKLIVGILTDAWVDEVYYQLDDEGKHVVDTIAAKNYNNIMDILNIMKNDIYKRNSIMRQVINSFIDYNSSDTCHYFIPPTKWIASRIR